MYLRENWVVRFFIRCWLHLLLFFSHFFIFTQIFAYIPTTLFFLSLYTCSPEKTPRDACSSAQLIVLFFSPPDPLPPPHPYPFCVNTSLLHLLLPKDSVILQILLARFIIPVYFAGSNQLLAVWQPTVLTQTVFTSSWVSSILGSFVDKAPTGRTTTINFSKRWPLRAGDGQRVWRTRKRGVFVLLYKITREESRKCEKKKKNGWRVHWLSCSSRRRNKRNLTFSDGARGTRVLELHLALRCWKTNADRWNNFEMSTRGPNKNSAMVWPSLGAIIQG